MARLGLSGMLILIRCPRPPFPVVVKTEQLAKGPPPSLPTDEAQTDEQLFTLPSFLTWIKDLRPRTS